MYLMTFTVSGVYTLMYSANHRMERMKNCEYRDTIVFNVGVDTEIVLIIICVGGYF